VTVAGLATHPVLFASVVATFTVFATFTMFATFTVLHVGISLEAFAAKFAHRFGPKMRTIVLSNGDPSGKCCSEGQGPARNNCGKGDGLAVLRHHRLCRRCVDW
jgi:hypothetical protein